MDLVWPDYDNNVNAASDASDGRLSVLQFALLFRLSHISYVHAPRIFMYTLAVCHFSVLDIHRRYIGPHGQ